MSGKAGSAPQARVLRSQLGRVRGLGSAHGGTEHWWAQRVTAVALVPLTLWFVWSLLHLAGEPRAAVVVWAGHTVNAALLVALVLATFRHAQLGLQVVLEDYIADERARLIAILLAKGVTTLLGLMSLLAVLKLALGG
jgi:succinate dehydrogenase / fumarate reductase, membrane anchor subunit